MKRMDKHDAKMIDLSGDLLFEIVTLEGTKKRLIKLAVSMLEPLHGKRKSEQIIRENLNDLSK